MTTDSLIDNMQVSRMNIRANGWSVENKTIYYKSNITPGTEKLTGAELKQFIRNGFKKETLNLKLGSEPLENLLNAVNSLEFQAKQVEDFITRLNKKVLPIIPTGYTYKLSKYLKTKLGKALVLDQHVNRPSYVKPDFGKALDYFYDLHKDDKESVSKNPDNWGNKHAEYEATIIEYYGNNRRGTDMVNRYDNLKDKL